MGSFFIMSNSYIMYQIYPSIWSGIKPQFQTLTSNSRWFIGNGIMINFWTHNRSYVGILGDLFNLSPQIAQRLHSKVQDFISSFEWIVPIKLQNLFPTLLGIINNNIIPLEDKEDMLVFKNVFPSWCLFFLVQSIST